MAQQGNPVKELKQIYDILGYPPAQRVLWLQRMTFWERV